ncbi:MAG: hypothetical protein NXH82_12105 [Rhodobacteraceae bacterium]|nr:hypothetical protein [Paracoccaceae bacterium]
MAFAGLSRRCHPAVVPRGIARVLGRYSEQPCGHGRSREQRGLGVGCAALLEWAYRYDRSDIAAAIDGLLSATELMIEAADDVGPALELYRTERFGFSDLMIAAAARRAGGTELVTFDRKAARLPDVRLLGECPIFCVLALWSMLPERSKDDDDFQGTAGRTSEGLRTA